MERHTEHAALLGPRGTTANQDPVDRVLIPGFPKGSHDGRMVAVKVTVAPRESVASDVSDQPSDKEKPRDPKAPGFPSPVEATATVER